MTTKLRPFQIRVPAATATAIATASASAHCSMSEYARRAIATAIDNPDVLLKAMRHRFGREMGELRTTSLALTTDVRDAVIELSAYTHMPANDIYVLAIEAAAYNL